MQMRVHSGGDIFHNTYDTKKPLEFTLGQGRVIKGLDKGLLKYVTRDTRASVTRCRMCVGEQRKLFVPADHGLSAVLCACMLTVNTWQRLARPDTHPSCLVWRVQPPLRVSCVACNASLTVEVELVQLVKAKGKSRG